MTTMKLQQLGRDELLLVMPNAKSRADVFLPVINKYAAQYGVDTTLRMAHFLAQIAHESGELRYTEELASGAAYEGRKSLGNTEKGDGKRFKGRGLIQLTGRANYTAISRDLGIDFVGQPTLLATAEYAVLSAFWFWQKKGLNALADKDDLVTITRRINGGTNGLADRRKYYLRAKLAMKV